MNFAMLGLSLAFVIAITLADYCPAGPTSELDSNLGSVYLQGDVLTIDERSDCPGKTMNQDFLHLVADLTAHRWYTLSYNITTCGRPYPRSSAVWIDYNGNEEFEETERIIIDSTGNETYELITAQFSVPNLNVPKLTTRMRVMVRESSESRPIDNACSVFESGGVKDFTIELTDAYCEGGPTSTLDSNLGAVSLVGNTLNISDNTNCPGSVGVQLFLSQLADLQVGSTYTLEYNVTTCNTRGVEYSRSSAAWIDWNGNMIFEESEQVAQVLSSTSETVSQQFQVPRDAAIMAEGTRLRVLVHESVVPTTDPCIVFAYGAVKDFTILSLAPDDNSNNGGGSVGAVVGGLFGFAVLVGAAVLYRRHHLKASSTGLINDSSGAHGDYAPLT